MADEQRDVQALAARLTQFKRSEWIQRPDEPIYDDETGEHIGTLGGGRGRRVPRPEEWNELLALADELVLEHTRQEASGAGRIAAERQRQIDAEGWAAEHDDDHTRNELAWAAASYAIPAAPGPIYEGEHPTYLNPETGLPVMWPWEPDWWKPSPDDRIRELVKAGALIAAEIDRIERSLAGERGREA